MKRLTPTMALLAILASGSAMAAKPADKPGHGHAPVTNPGPDLIISLPDTPAPTRSNFHSPVSLVPEPESVAMALAGLGVVGFVAARRKKK